MKTLKLFFILTAIVCLNLNTQEAKSQDRAIKEVVYKSDIKGPNCANKLSSALLDTEGIENTSVDLESKTIKVKYNTATTDKTKIQEVIAKAGYTSVETKDYKGKAAACCGDKTVQKSDCCKKTAQKKGCCGK